MADAKTEKQKVQEITEKLEQDIKELFESEKYKIYLNTMSKFHNYSFNNTMQDVMNVNQKEYKIVKLLGHGKGGYSYLAEREGKFYVLKQIHHEPCEYYSFGNKIEAEQNDYNRLLQTGIRIPRMLDIDVANERILKEYMHH